MQWLMLQQEAPQDFVIATGEQHSVRDFVGQAAWVLGIRLVWSGEGLNEEGIVDAVDQQQFFQTTEQLNASVASRISDKLKPGRTVVRIDLRYFRPTEVETLLGDPTRAREKLGWQPQISFQELVREMVAHDLEQAQRDDLCMQAGFPILKHTE